jgi:hypothetical protein
MQEKTPQALAFIELTQNLAQQIAICNADSKIEAA